MMEKLGPIEGLEMYLGIYWLLPGRNKHRRKQFSATREAIAAVGKGNIDRIFPLVG
jgi:hypothetical protein